MVARSDPSGSKDKEIRRLLSEWFAEKGANTVAFREVIEPVSDPYCDYSVVYEAVFEPSRLDQARVEIWVTTVGEVAIGFERRKRVAERLGVKSRRDRFVAGHEPYAISASGLFAILDSIAAGQIAVSPTVIPLFGLASTRAVTLRSVLRELASKGYSQINWLRGVSQKDLTEEGRFLKFHRWT